MSAHTKVGVVIPTCNSELSLLRLASARRVLHASHGTLISINTVKVIQRLLKHICRLSLRSFYIQVPTRDHRALSVTFEFRMHCHIRPEATAVTIICINAIECPE